MCGSSTSSLKSARSLAACADVSASSTPCSMSNQSTRSRRRPHPGASGETSTCSGVLSAIGSVSAGKTPLATAIAAPIMWRIWWSTNERPRIDTRRYSVPPRRSSRRSSTRQRSTERHACGWRLAGSSASVQLSPPALHSWAGARRRSCASGASPRRCAAARQTPRPRSFRSPPLAAGTRTSATTRASARGTTCARASRRRRGCRRAAALIARPPPAKCHGTSFADGASPSTISSSSVSSLSDAAAPSAWTPLSVRGGVLCARAARDCSRRFRPSRAARGG